MNIGPDQVVNALATWGTLAVVVIVLAFAVATLVNSRGKRVAASANIERQDGLYAAGSRAEMLTCATDLRRMLNDSVARGAPPGLLDTHAITLNSLVNRAVPGARWDWKRREYLVVEGTVKVDMSMRGKRIGRSTP